MIASGAAPSIPAERLDVLEAVEARVLWLATSIVHHANRVRAPRSGLKVGGHQASSASAVSIMTALYFEHLRAQDLVSVKPHASPVLHAIEYLLGRLPPEYLTTLRAYHGLQSYPSRLKDPVPADYSTGSVGIGATATIWSALARRYAEAHLDLGPGGRHIAVLGDAELDEGAIWEALLDPVVADLGEVLWIVDLNRQSLDRVVPNVAARRLERMFEAAGWDVITLKYGRTLERLFERDGGEELRVRLDSMSNEEYQRLLRAPADHVRESLPASPAARRLLAELDDDELVSVLRDLGGHDLGLLVDAFARSESAVDRPSVVFAYTHKGWRLPIEGHPANHSALLSDEQWERLGPELGAQPSEVWVTFPEGSAAHALCVEAAERLERPAASHTLVPELPGDFRRSHPPSSSTQHAFGRFFLELARTAPEVARRTVTISPDVASSTNLGGWINKVGVWHVADRVDWFHDDPERLLQWREVRRGQHIELGIAEGNLVGLLGELGATWSRYGEPLFPIGTLYDPFVNRALEQWSFGMYAGGQSILVGTPSGVTLAPEGGAHQSIITPSVGLAQPGCIAWEPAFSQDLEWTLLHALSLLGRVDGESSYFRLSTRPVDQSLAAVPADPAARETRRRHAIAGGYVLVRAERRPSVTLVGTGAVMPEVLDASAALARNGIDADVVCLTSADLVFRALRAQRGLSDGQNWILDELFPADRAAPLVTVIDGHPHTLSFLAGIRAQPLTALGVDDFGQSGDIPDLYEHFGIDAETIEAVAADVAVAAA